MDEQEWSEHHRQRDGLMSVKTQRKRGPDVSKQLKDSGGLAERGPGDAVSLATFLEFVAGNFVWLSLNI